MGGPHHPGGHGGAGHLVVGVADHPYDEVVKILNERGVTGGWGKAFNVRTELRPVLLSETHRTSRLMLTEIRGRS